MIARLEIWSEGYEWNTDKADDADGHGFFLYACRLTLKNVNKKQADNYNGSRFLDLKALWLRGFV
ncbi:MAG: hypothetical protein Q9P14_05530 [candidate division KSB1 bacterium]|nr:hypothetical protein [candidate division KSB1 bacterium]MDQ7063715.1 hypothetical protein [candidate division KSB1 bacterium]